MNSFFIMLAIVAFTAVFTLSPIEEKKSAKDTSSTIWESTENDIAAESTSEDVSVAEISEETDVILQEESEEEIDEILEDDIEEINEENTGVPFSFFNDSIIVGDSIANQLSAYTARVRNSDPDYFGSIRFGGVGNYGINNALSAVSSTSTHHVYQGVTMNTPDYIATRHNENPIDTVYMMMGMNDLNIFKEIDKTVEAYGRLLDSIREKNPSVNIVVLGLTPVGEVFTVKSSRHNPEYMTNYNLALETYCSENGYGYINPYPYFADERGLLPDHLASADGFHLTDEGYGLFVEMLCEEAGHVHLPSVGAQVLDEIEEIVLPDEMEFLEVEEPSPLDYFFQSLIETLPLPTDLENLHTLFLQEQYGINTQDMVQLVAKQTASYGIGVVDTFIFAQVESEEQAKEIAKIWEITIEGFLNQNKLYDIVAYDIYAKSEIVQQGEYLALIITEESSSIKDAYLRYLNS